MPEPSAPLAKGKAEAQASTMPSRLRFLVAIEFSSKEAAVDHMVDQMNTGWPWGPKIENLKLIVIDRVQEQGRISGLEIGTEQLRQLDQRITTLDR